VLAYAAEESQRLAHRHIGTDHLLLGFLHEEGSSAARALHEAGLELSLVREQAGGQSQGAPETAYDELHRLIDELRPEHLEAAAQALRSLKSGAPLSASAVFVSPSLGESGTARAFAGAALGYGVFDRYTEQARRSIFFARYEASQFGTKAVESEHLLLGLLRENVRVRDPKGHRATEAARPEDVHVSRSPAQRRVQARDEVRGSRSPRVETPADW
jgi:ATP-dependent Clp protease ATP-binding subunit ClpA